MRYAVAGFRDVALIHRGAAFGTKSANIVLTYTKQAGVLQIATTAGQGARHNAVR